MSSAATPHNPQTVTVREVIDLYLRHAEIEAVHCAEARVERVRVLALFVAIHGEMLVADCKPYHLTDFIEAHPGWKSVSTRRAKANMIRAAFQWAAEGERTDRNPFLRVRYAEAEPRPCMPDDVLEEVLDCANKRFERAVRFLRLTGCRVGELSALIWPGVDLEKGLAIIERHKSRKHTRKPKRIVLVEEAVELLKAIRAKQPPEYQGHVFLNNCDRPWNRVSLAQQLRRLKARGLVSTNASLHGLRHAWATQAVRNGANMKYIAEALGHQSSLVTERFYSHVSGDVKEIRDAANLAQVPKPAA